jgi:hypothetical protein
MCRESGWREEVHAARLSDPFASALVRVGLPGVGS